MGPFWHDNANRPQSLESGLCVWGGGRGGEESASQQEALTRLPLLSCLLLVVCGVS